MDLVDEYAAGDAEIGGSLELFGPDRADVLEPQSVVVTADGERAIAIPGVDDPVRTVRSAGYALEGV